MGLVAQWAVLWSFLIGVVGSLAYFTVVYFGFIGPGREGRNYILAFFWGANGRITTVKVSFYCMIGGLIAGIFQLPQGEFVPIQSFVLGATWPSIVGQLLSGRQSGPSQEELARLGISDQVATAAEAAAREASEEATRLLEV